MPSNNLRVNLYNMLLPRIIEEDQKFGELVNANLWDENGLKKWDNGLLWDDNSQQPILQTIFYAIESETIEELELIDNLPDLVNPDKCPEKFLDYLAKHYGYSFNFNVSTQKKRELIKASPYFNKIKGTNLSWQILYKILGWDVKVFELYKKSIKESKDRYSREKFVTEDKSINISGSSGTYQINIGTNILPGSILFKSSDNILVVRDNYNGKLIGNTVESSSINYAKGDIKLSVSSIPASDITITYKKIKEKYPYKAARIDIEFFFYVGEEVTEINTEVVDYLINNIDEVKPLRVEVRAYIITLDIRDTIENFANDYVGCGGGLQYGENIAVADIAPQPKEMFSFMFGDEKNFPFLDKSNICVNDLLEMQINDESPIYY